ncbi:PREDICTED: cilia- and flagella-associated protein 74 isoform X1 [Ficedula albicollis]|uniref:cilia- and flagella-associated protein 74 isoform X1 n=2 Tax=Ficedula albicollis TaxID=59894 RepID=UPI0007AD837A|nr:PREDICTED: cilia- and flagella-associated protein 74 isoform X1 [Ficedula albicollis]
MEEHWEEYDLEEELDGSGKMENRDTSEDAGDQSDSSMQSSGHSLGSIGNIWPLKSADRIHISASQRNFQLLDNMVRGKELAVQKTSDTLSACRLRSRVLAKQLDHVDMEIEREEEAGNVAAVSRLQAVSSRLCTELEREKELELRLALTLKQNLVELWQIETEQGKYDNLREQLQKDEEELQMQYQEEKEVRIWKEKITALQAEGTRRTREKREEKAQRECEERNKKLLEDAKRNHEKAVCFLKQSMARIHEKNAKEEVKAQEHMERRIQAVLSLKTSITSNRERLQTLQILNRAKALEAKKEEMKMREAILAKGGNVIREIFLHKKQQEHEKKKEAFRELQKSRKMEIVSRILQERASIHKQRKSQSPTKAIKARGKLRDPLLQSEEAWQSEETYKHADGEISQPWCSPSVCSLAGEGAALQGESSENRPQDVLWESDDEDTDRDKTLLVPEFPGLWNREYDFHKVAKAEDPTLLAIRAMRKQMAEKKMEEHQTQILHKQTVPRKQMAEKKMEEYQTQILHRQTVPSLEHKGCAFHSKPSCIHFKDFDVGQIYKKKIVLTNASYSVNYCRLVGISEWLKDFISVHFDPPGKMSSGMSCEFLVTFKPMINKELEGAVMFMAQTGPFSVPLKCTVKTCILALDKELIDFGSLVVGETISRTISLTNSGALGTRFKVQTSAGATSTLRATVKAAPARVVSEHSPEGEGSMSPVAAGNPNKEQICAEPSVGVTPCAAQEHESSSSMEQLGEGELNTGSYLDTDNEDNLLELSPEEIPVEIVLGKVTEGEIGPFSSVKIPVLFVPAVPGDVRAVFVIVFDNPDCKPLSFSAIGVSVDVPIWVPQPSVDLRICLYERLYQDSVEVRSRATTMLRLKFEVCRELSKHMELLPKTGYIQAQSSFSAQLKFLPRLSLPEDAGSYFNAETGVLEVPVTILIVDKAKKVNFTVHAIVTTSDLEISPAQINFGYCTIYEAVQTNVILTNKSILPQEFGFVGLPKFVEVQPNDGFGIILPLESLTLDIIFKATKAKEYSFELTCRTEINRQFKLSCKAVGVHPPLELSHSLVQFAATALSSVSSATLDILNSHVDGNPLTHPVPRIGTGDPVPVGPTSFEFHVPQDCPVTITPSVGTVLPGQKSSIRVSFSPALTDQQIREEAVRRLSTAAVPEAEEQISSGPPQSPVGKKRKDSKRERKKSTVSISRRRAGSRKSLDSVNSSKEPKPEELKPDSDAYRAAQASLTRSFRGSFNKYIIPCSVASGHTTGEEGSGNLTFSPHNTLYLELHCPAVAPPVLITSDSGINAANFGDVSVGLRIMKRITIENISPEKLELGFSVLNPNGPFLLVRAVGTLEPGENKPLIISFCPSEDKWFLETLDIQMAKTNLSLLLSGHGVVPSTECSVGELLDMGYVMAGDTGTATVEIKNTSNLTLPFSIQLESLSPTRDRDRQKIPSFLTSSLQRTEIVGTQNYNGFSVFSVSPTEGKIEAGKSQDFVVTFSPDHESLYYSDHLKVLLFGKQTAHEIHLKGAARNHPMFVEGGVPLDVPVESLAVTSPVAPQEALEEGSGEAVRSLLLLLEYVEGSAEPARAEITVGAMESPLLAAKKAVEFSLASGAELQRAGFALDGPRGALERGQQQRIGVSWLPPAELQTSEPPLISALLTVKGDITESYRVLLMARVVSAAAPTA